MKDDETYKANNPTQGLSTSGRLPDCRNKSTYSLEQKSMKAHGSPRMSMVLGKYVQAVTSFMISFDKAMKVVFSEEAARDAARISLQPASP